MVGPAPLGDLDAGGAGHLDVKHGHVGLVFGDEAAGGVAVVGFGHDAQVGGPLQKLADAGANDAVVVGQEDADGGGHGDIR